MKIVGFEVNNGLRLGVVEGDAVIDLQAADAATPSDLGESLRASNGASLTFNSIAVANTGGTIEAQGAGSTVNLNNSTITVGCNNIFGEDPPQEFGFEFGNAFGIPGSTYDNIGRFVYARLTKKF